MPSAMAPVPPRRPRGQAARLSRRQLAAGALAGLLLPGSAALTNRTSALAAEDAPADVFTPVLMRSLGPTTAPVLGDDERFHLMYDLWLTNAKAAQATIERIEVVDHDDPARVVATLEGEALLSVLTELSTRPAADASLAPGASKLLFVNVTFDSFADIPSTVAHRFSGLAAANPGTTEPTPLTYVTAPLPLDEISPVVLAAPLRGERWLATNAPGMAVGPHRSSVQSVNGTLFNAQRFAIDWIQLDEAGRFVTSDPGDLTNWVGYDAPLYAAADGTVVAMLDELPDQVPGQLPDPASITLETVDGNHVVLDIGGSYLFYAHMRPGSVAVELGQRVQAGELLGHLGNSGNSSAPHLHLHAMNHSSVLGSDSLPYVHDAFTLVGALDPAEWAAVTEMTGVWDIQGQPVASGSRALCLPQNLHVISWPV